MSSLGVYYETGKCADGLPGLLPAGQTSRESYLLERKMYVYLSRTSGQVIFPALFRYAG